MSLHTALLTWKSRRRRWLMRLLDLVCTETRVSIHTESMLDYIDASKKTTDLFLEFRIYRHTFRFGKGKFGLSVQFNITQVDCVRHFLDLNLQYAMVSETYYGLSPKEYFDILNHRIKRLGQEDGHHGRWYVKKRKHDYT